MKRNSNIELLRIVAMLLIVLHHYSVHGPWPALTSMTTSIAVDFLSFGGKLGVDAFVLITGYYVSRSCFKSQSLLRLVLQTLFYSWLILALQMFLSPESVTFDSVKAALLPLTHNQYWFVTTYVVLTILSPLINKCLSTLSFASKSKIIAIGFVLFSVVPTFILVDAYTSNVVWFCFLYVVGAYIRDFADSEVTKSDMSRWLGVVMAPINWAIRKPLLAFIVCLTVVLASIAGIDYLKFKDGFALVSATYLIAQNMIPTFLMSVALFSFFQKLKPFYSGTINWLAKGVFGVYLIHDNSFIRSVIWKPFAPVFATGGYDSYSSGLLSLL